MTCKLSKERLISFLYEELTPDEQKDVEGHLSGCASCRKELAGLRSSRNLLSISKDEEPDLTLSFVQEKVSFFSFLKKKWASLRIPQRVAWGVSLGTFAGLLLLSLLNFEISYRNGNFYMQFGFLHQASELPRTDTAQPVTRQEFDAWKAKSLQLVSDMMEANREQQKQDLNDAVLRLAGSIEAQRQQDLQLVGRGLEVLQNSSETQFRRRDEVLQQLIRVASYRGKETNR